MATTGVTKTIPKPITTTIPHVTKTIAIPLNVHTRQTFLAETVRWERQPPHTKAMIERIIPYFPARSKVISAYLTEEELYWKVNYHWDKLVTHLEMLLARKETSDEAKTKAEGIRKSLWTVPPNPPRGYRNDKFPGDTKDDTGRARAVARHKVLKQAKARAMLVFAEAGVITMGSRLNPPKAHKGWWLSVAPVALPKYGTHKTGYALDIAGNNLETIRIATALAATMVFPESSHIHVEFMPQPQAP